MLFGSINSISIYFVKYNTNSDATKLPHPHMTKEIAFVKYHSTKGWPINQLQIEINFPVRYKHSAGGLSEWSHGRFSVSLSVCG